MREALRFGAGLSAIAFVLHLFWEYAQCSLFFLHDGVPPGHAAMLRAVLGDVVLTWIAYAAAALLGGGPCWARQPWTRAAWCALILSALVLSIGVELHALALGRWSYSSINPVIPGLGVSLLPVAQLLLLFPLSIRLAVGRCILRPEPAS